jgi:aminomethyltransferase
MVPFAGYAMPVQYPSGILAEHEHTRAAAGLFDVSHMGQLRLTARGGKPRQEAARALERLVPAALVELEPGRMRYTQLTNGDGGILDDLMVTAMGDHLTIIVNAGCKQADTRHLRAHLSDDCEIEAMESRALLALQGPRAVEVFARFVPQVRELAFMQAATWTFEGDRLQISRSGYTGEDGFEIMLPAEDVQQLWDDLILGGVVPCGLGARDTLRLEAGMNLYGQDMDSLTLPGEAGLSWTISLKDADRDFIGRAAITGLPVQQKMVGLVLQAKGVMRAHMTVLTAGGLGEITSGTMSPTLGVSIAMARVPESVTTGDEVSVQIRGHVIPAKVCGLPFVRRGKVLVSLS